MKRLIKCNLEIRAIFFVSFLLTNALWPQSRSSPIIADHQCIDLAAIPETWINTVKQNYKIFQASTSHGFQVIEGMLQIEKKSATYSFAWDYSMPSEANTLCFQYQPWYEPELFFNNVGDYLNANPQINVAIYLWCGQASWYDVHTYVSEMEKLERNYPKVIFVYSTGNAQESDCPGCGRHLFNEYLRKYCRENNKVLFDFGDLDVWYNNEMHTYICPNWCTCAGEAIPLEHPHYHGDQAGHTTYESCENKAKAFWWLLAKVAGWVDATPVTLVSFKALVEPQKIHLVWETASELSNWGFEIERSDDQITFTKIGAVPGSGTSAKPQEYSFDDVTVLLNHRYYYRLKQIDLNGRTYFSDIVEATTILPESFDLQQNYPNPFREETDIQYLLGQDQEIDLAIYNVLGERVATIFRGMKKAGIHTHAWRKSEATSTVFAPGLFFLVLKTSQKMVVKKMILL